MSYAQKSGANYDNEIANSVEEATGKHITTHSMRGSGNTKHPQLDVLIRTPKVDHFAELKKTSMDRGKRSQIFDKDDIRQIGSCANPYTRVYVGVYMTHCELLFFEVTEVTDVAKDIAEKTPDAFDVNLTKDGNITMRKPETDDWPTSRSGRSDVEVICETIGVQYE